MKRAAQGWVVVVIAVFSLSVLIQAQDAASAPAASATVPRMVKFSGTASDVHGSAVTGIAGMTFSIYKEQQGGAALWMETQNVKLDSSGHYSVLLGATRPEGLPTELFASGEARWIGVRVNGQAESARVVLLSVPYALKASDAETLGGLPASAFLRAAPPVVASSSSDASSSSSTSASPSIAATPCATITADGTASNTQLTKFTGPCTVHQSIMSDNGSTVTVNGSESVRGTLNLPSIGAATSTGGKNSQPLDLFSTSFSSTLLTSINQHFRLLAEPAGNNTTTPSGTLNLQYATGTGTPAETGISFTSGGTFKAKTVSATTLSGNGASLSNVNATKLGGLASSAFAQLGAANDNFTGNVTAANLATGGTVKGVTGNISGNLSVGGAEAVTGNLSSGGTVSGATGSFSGNLSVGGAASATGNLTSGATISGVTGAFSGNLGVSGNGVFSGSVGIGVAPTALLTLSQANGSPSVTATPLQSITNTRDASASMALVEPFRTWRIGINRPPDNSGSLDGVFFYDQNSNSTKMSLDTGGNMAAAGAVQSKSGGFIYPAGNTIAQEYWAVVNPDSTLAHSSGTTGSSLLSTGQYEVDFSTNVSACAYSATPAFGPSFLWVAPRTGVANGVFVATYDSTGTLSSSFGFHLVVHC